MQAGLSSIVEMAAPAGIEDSKWHRSQQTPTECGWKRGESAMEESEAQVETDRASRWSALNLMGEPAQNLSMREEFGTVSCLPLVGNQADRYADLKLVLDEAGFLMEAATVRERGQLG